MIDHVWTVICSRAVIDRDSNNVSIQNVIEQLTVKDEPKPGMMVPILLEAVTLWVRADPNVPGQARARLTFLSPSGKAFGSVESEIDLSKFERYRSRVHFQGLPIEEPGRHVFCVELQEEGKGGWRQVAVVPLSVVFTPSEETWQAGGR